MEVLPLALRQAPDQCQPSCGPSRGSLALWGLARTPSLTGWLTRLSVTLSLLNTFEGSPGPPAPHPTTLMAHPRCGHLCGAGGSQPCKDLSSQEPMGCQLPNMRQASLVFLKKEKDLEFRFLIACVGLWATLGLWELNPVIYISALHLQSADDKNSSLVYSEQRTPCH